MADINEMNEVIAAFDGKETERVGNHVFGIDRDNNGNIIGRYGALYDGDWPSLMKVVEKIELMDYGFKMCRKRVEFYRDSTKELIIDVKMGSRIESLFAAVYEAVKWLNQNDNGK